jgi:hypothetical protein
MKGKVSTIEDDFLRQIVNKNNEIIDALRNLSKKISSDKKQVRNKCNETSRNSKNNQEV